MGHRKDELRPGRPGHRRGLLRLPLIEGYGSGRIASLFLVKAALIGVVGAAVGYAAGTVLTLEI